MDDAPPSVAQEAVTFTLGSTIDELISATFWRAAELGTPVVEAVDAHRVNIHYPSDGSMVTIRLEHRPGAWGGLRQGPLTPEEEDLYNQKFSDALAASLPPPPVEPPPEEPAARREENPVYEVQRQ
jgi:hypothetical protein